MNFAKNFYIIKSLNQLITANNWSNTYNYILYKLLWHTCWCSFLGLQLPHFQSWHEWKPDSCLQDLMWWNLHHSAGIFLCLELYIFKHKITLEIGHRIFQLEFDLSFKLISNPWKLHDIPRLFRSPQFIKGEE